MSIRELLFGVKDEENPTQTQLFNDALRYFAEHQKHLDHGGFKKKHGRVTVSISFVLDEGKAQS